MTGPLVPEDDLYARLEVALDASPEAIDLAWRALLKRHHPDVAGEDAAVLERAKRINVAHDWLSDPGLRARYDEQRLGSAATAPGRTVVRRGRSPRGEPWRGAAGRRPSGRPDGASSRGGSSRAASTGAPRSRPDLFRGDPAQRLARFLERVGHLTADELDRLAAADPPPIAFLATIRRFLEPEARDAFATVEATLAATVPHERWAQAGLREGLLGVAAELVLAGFLDDTLAEPFRGRARERLLRAWEASVDQPRYGPNGTEVVKLREHVAALTAAEVGAFVRASQGIPGDDRPWPAGLSRDEDEGLRISALLAATDVAAALPSEHLPPATAARARRLLGRLGHVVALRHAFPPAAYAAMVAPFPTPVGGSSRPPGMQPGVSRAG